MTARRVDLEAGFTLIELVVVLGILAVTAAIAMPSLSRPAGDATLIATARQIASGMRIAQGSAIRDNADRVLTVDLASRRFWVAGVTAPASIASGIVVDIALPERELVTASKARMRFHPDGSASGGSIILRAAGRSIVVELDWMTGHANLRRDAP
jgi:general secretion pathway protein H